jgi:nicotinamide phosphoribosyltransferase
MSAGGKEDEYETYRRLIEDIYPSGFISIVSDTWDLWHVVDKILPRLKDKIMSREGKVVIRPDSGNPVDIICGNPQKHPLSSPSKGLIETLWDIFGGTINSKGYKELDPHIGAIYGDSITLGRAAQICEQLKIKGFSSTNIVFGIGSYTYQYNTRDTLGWAVKATYAEVNGIGRAITKDPVTDDGTKKSHSGLLKVVKSKEGEYQVLQNQTWDQFYADDNELKLAFKDGLSYL